MASLRQQKIIRWQKKHFHAEQPLILPPSPKHSFSEYLSKQQQKLQKHVNSYEKDQLRKQQMENYRLIRRLSEISRRKNSLGHNEDFYQQQMYTINITSRRKQRERREKTLQHQNDIMIERIMRMRRHNSSLVSNPETSPQKSHHSVVLPSIDEYTHK